MNFLIKNLISHSQQTQQSSANTSPSAKLPKKITDLPLELLLDIYENLSLLDLRNLAASHPKNRCAAEMVFKSKFGNKELLIDHTGIETVEVALKASSINIFNIDFVLKILKQFGHLISKLKIYYDRITEQNCEKINKLLSERSCDSLTEITLLDTEAKKLVGLTGPFNRVESVTFRRRYVTSSDINMSQVFPVVTRIHSTSLSQQYPAVIEQHLPHLKEINLGSLMFESSKIESQLRLNPQL